MSTIKRRHFLRNLTVGTGLGAGALLFPAAIRRALAVPPRRVTGTIEDVQHVVVLMQENRSFDHYFGTLRGVRGFGDRFPIPVPDRPGHEAKTVWFQSPGEAERAVLPFRLNTREDFHTMRVEGTPHHFTDAQAAWAEGKLHEWVRHKTARSMAYYGEADIPFQFALAEAFTLCDAYHCAMHAGTNPNRCFLWTGSNDPQARGGGPVVDNAYDNLEHDPRGGYLWATYCERLEAQGIRWQVYQDMRDNFTDNPLAGFRSFRAAHREEPGALASLAQRGLSTRDLEQLADDVRADRLPQVSFIVATAEGSEHPGPSSPAQGADYTARVLDALTSNPEVWAKTVLFVNFDENDGFFDHVPPPAPPSKLARNRLAGGSTVDTRGEYHEISPSDGDAYLHRPYGLGPRVPMYVVSPWSKGGWVASQVFDHTSVIRFMERRFRVFEPNISPWRRAVCGDLTSAFDFAAKDERVSDVSLPDTRDLAERASSLRGHRDPDTPEAQSLPAQEYGVRMSRALPYDLHVHARVKGRSVELTFVNSGEAGAVFHVYDRQRLTQVPRRYTVEGQRTLVGHFALQQGEASYDLWVLGPNGFHRHFTGRAGDASEGSTARPEIEVGYDRRRGNVFVVLLNTGAAPCTFVTSANAYFQDRTWEVRLGPWRSTEQQWSLEKSAHWYDFTVRVEELPGYTRRFAGRVETGRDGYSDPAMGGVARGDQLKVR